MKLGKLNDLMVDLIGELKCASYSSPSMSGMIYIIVPPVGNWDYCYRRIAYLSSSWEGIYITGIKMKTDITAYVDEVVI